jgi:hypothetical protein
LFKKSLRIELSLDVVNSGLSEETEVLKVKEHSRNEWSMVDFDDCQILIDLKDIHFVILEFVVGSDQNIEMFSI